VGRRVAEGVGRPEPLSEFGWRGPELKFRGDLPQVVDHRIFETEVDAERPPLCHVGLDENFGGKVDHLVGHGIP